MYTWGYIKEACLAKLDLEEEEATVQNLLSRFPFYANEVITQICSAIKPKHTFAEFNVFKKEDRWRDLVKKYNLNYTSIVSKPNVVPDNEIDFWSDWENSHFVFEAYDMPDDFVSFDDDVNTISYVDVYGDKWLEECHDDQFSYIGYNQIQFFRDGLFKISYNARWYEFTKAITDDTRLNIPTDILDCIPSYVAHQCYKIDNEIKAQIFRNEYEMFLSRIDDTHFKQSKTFKIGGDW